MGVDRALDITAKQRKIVTDLLERHLPNTTAWVYGSRAKWASRPQSDLDLVVFATPEQNRRISDLREALEESNLPFRVDLFVWDTVPEQFRKQIKSEHVVLVERQERDVADEWDSAPLEDLVNNILDRRGVTPRKLGSDFVSAGHRVISAKVIKGCRLDLAADEPRFVDAVTYQKWMKSPLLADDVILTSEAPVGEPAYVAQDVEWCLGQRLFGIRTNKTKLHGRFLYYALQSEEVLHDLLSRATGTTVQGIRQTELKRVVIPLPPLPEQRTIAHILGTLDDKIELNRRMNETLEAMARALFKSWFVDFEPVHAKMAGRDTGLPRHLADLFPDRLVDSELGEIPEGWEVTAFDETVKVLGGGTPKTSIARYWNGDVPWFAVVDAPNKHDVWVVDTQRKITEAAIRDLSTRILPEKTTIVSARGTVGRLALVGVPMAMNQSCYGLRGAIDGFDFFTYHATRSLVVAFRQQSHGSVFGTITRQTLNSIPVVWPLPDVIHAYEKRVSPTFERIRTNTFASRTLAAARDALLPKLVSGQIRLHNAKRFAKVAQ